MRGRELTSDGQSPLPCAYFTRNDDPMISHNFLSDLELFILIDPQDESKKIIIEIASLKKDNYKILRN